MLMMLAVSIYSCHNNYKNEHQLNSQRWILSCAWYLVVCAALLMIWAPCDLWNYWEKLNECVKEISDNLPILLSVSCTMIGLFCMFILLRPRMHIANEVVYISSSGRLVFHVSSRNIFTIHNMQPKLYKCTYQDNKVLDPIELEELNLTSLDGIFAHRNNRCMECATKYKSEEVGKVLEEMRKDKDVCLRFDINATHIISDITNVFSKTYYINDVLHGRFQDDGYVYSLYADGRPKQKISTRQNTIDRVHSIALFLEGAVIIFMLALAVCMTINKPQYINVLLWDICTLGLCSVEMLRFVTDIRIEAEWNEKNSFLRFPI